MTPKTPQPLLLLLFLLSLSFSLTTKSLNSSCLCDISSQCDYQCCCDSQCSSTMITQLQAYSLCDDDTFGIPLCTTVNITDQSVNDLHSGLNTIYTIIKRLFCVYRINIVDPTLFYIRNSTAAQIVTSESISIQFGGDSVPQKIQSLTTKTVTGIIYRSQSGICYQSNTLYIGVGTNGPQQCRAPLTDYTTISSSSYLSVNTLCSSMNITRVYLMSDSSSLTPTNIYTTSLSTSCSSSTTCTYVVRYIKLYITPSGSIQPTLSYIIVGQLQNLLLPIYINVKYYYQYLNTDGTFANSSNVGYQSGSLLQLLKVSSSTQYYKVNNPVNLGYRDTDGNCLSSSTSSTTADQSLVQLKLGVNQFHSCIGTSTLLSTNLKLAFDYIGVMGSSNTVISDYIAVDWSAISSSDPTVILKIHYVKIGSSQNPQYYILKAVASVGTSTSTQSSLYVQYQEVSNKASLYIPDPPSVDAYLPNDFLYPFYVAQ